MFFVDNPPLWSTTDNNAAARSKQPLKKVIIAKIRTVHNNHSIKEDVDDRRTEDTKDTIDRPSAPRAKIVRTNRQYSSNSTPSLSRTKKTFTANCTGKDSSYKNTVPDQEFVDRKIFRRIGTRPQTKYVVLWN